MTTAVQRLSTKKSPVQSPKFTEDPEFLSEENLNKVTEALKTPSNLDELMKQLTNATKTRMESTFKSSDLLSPIKRNAQSAVYSPNSTVKFFEPMEHLNSSDEDECTFHPKINPNAGRLTARVSTGGKIHETLHSLAAEREVKSKEVFDQHGSHINERSSVSKIGPKSVKMIYQKLQQSIRSLVNNNESAENSGQVNFEGLGTILYQLGVFQTLEFTPSGNDGEKSSLSINQTKAKPERITKEIMFHENLYKICNTASSDENAISGDLVFKFLMVLVEEKTPVADSAYILQEIIDIAIEANGKTREEGKSLYVQAKEEKNLWSLEKVIIEFRKLFEDKTSFMNVYSPSNMIASKKLQQHQTYPHSHTPKTSSKTDKLDKRYFSETIVKNMTKVDPEVDPETLRPRNQRLYTYNTYLKNKKGWNVEARIQEELAPCTFAPKTTQYKKKKSQNNKTHDSSSINGRPSSSPSKKGYFHQALDECGAQRHMLLYEVAQHYREKLQQKAYSLKKKEEVGELSYCTFQPKLNHYYEDSAARGQDFYEGVPNGFKKIVDRLQKGEQLKQQRQAEAEKIPRGENYEKNRAAEFKPPVMLHRPKITKPEVLVYVDVSIGHGKTGRIGIHKGDNARTLAHHFARTHSLNNTMKESLETLLQSYIDNYFAQPTPKKPEDEGIQLHEENRHDDEEEDEEDDEEEGHGLEAVGEDEEGEREDQHRESM